MIGTQPTGTIPGVTIEAVSHEGLSVTVNGRPGQLAILDENGRVVAAGPDVAREAEAVAVNCYRNFLKGKGFLRVIKELPVTKQEGGAA
ncbi:hypothetical protein F5985_03225 [Malikia spinosa]|uniref:Uncharacterized protein n=1 Tax=Malikia spinosa TaxID=86180 RepID=A0A7C9IWL3_9BURK|nr:hypothetical protein [Malikia spinosa]MYZ51172.1 hypothetical protein [Malikia spinosa]